MFVVAAPFLKLKAADNKQERNRNKILPEKAEDMNTVCISHLFLFTWFRSRVVFLCWEHDMSNNKPVLINLSAVGQTLKTLFESQPVEVKNSHSHHVYVSAAISTIYI